MKKAIGVVALCLSLAVAAFSMDFSIRVNGGPNFLFGGDYNKIVEGANHPMYGPMPMDVTGEIKKLSLAWNFGAEFVLNFTDRMGLGLGVGYLTAGNDSNLTASFMILSESLAYKPSVSVIPITLSFHYSLPLGRVFKVHFSAGPGFYISSFDFENHFVMSMALTDLTETFDAKTKVFIGVQGGVGLEYAVGPSVSLTLDVLGRLLNMSDLSGNHTFTGMLLGFTGSLSYNNHMFYYAEVDGQAHYVIQGNMPSGSGIVNAREASVSLSGLCPIVGIKINF